MYERGEVWFARIPEVGVKPVVLVSDRTVSLAMQPVAARIASVERPRNVPTVIALAPGEVEGLAEASYVLCHDLMTVHDGGLVEQLGRIPWRRMVEVEDRLAFVLGLGGVR
jgi:mRNA-degrading endonuclease toxin of MazEF toxin-antitoxin module